MHHVTRVLLAATVLLLVALSLSTAQISRDSAITLVTDQVITPSPYNSTLVAFLYDPPGGDSLLPAGTDIAPFDSAFVTTLAGPKWFFWIDLTANFRFEHPVKFVLVDSADGTVDVSDGGWWPALTLPGDTTTYPWSSIDDRVEDSTGTIYGSYSGQIVGPAMVPSTVPRYISPEEPRDDGIRYFRFNSALSGNTCAILVGGRAQKKGEQNAWQGDLDSMNTAMNTPAPGGGTGMASETQMKNNATKADVQKMLDSAAAHGCNSIIFYYSGHGGKGGGGFMCLNGTNLKYSDLATMLNIAGLKFKDVILDDCFGGSSLDDFGGKSSTVWITTASDSTKTSSGTLTYYDRDHDSTLSPGDTVIGGSGKYTKAWMSCWRKLRDSLNRNPTTQEIHDCIRHDNPDSLNQKQNPSSSTIYPIISFFQTIPGPGIYQFTGTGVVIDFQSISGPTSIFVDRTLGPAQGQIDPIETEIVSLSLTSVWSIEMTPPVDFQANVFFGFPGAGSPGDAVPLENFSLATRPAPTFSEPNPLWNEFPNRDYQPSPAGIVALNVTEFSEWAYAFLATDTSVDVPHAAKWNMLSVPLQAADMHKDTLFPGATSNAFAYDGGYTTETVLEMGRGYWMKFDSAGSNTLFGTAVHQDTFPVASGWNMVGSITDPVPVGSVSTIPAEMTLSNFFAYNNGYTATSSIEPGGGYWVKTSTDGSIILDGGLLLAKAGPPVDYPGLNRLDISDAAGNTQSLWFGGAGAATAVLTMEMPPPPPGESFDARFADGNMVELYAGNGPQSYGIRLTSAAYPVTISWEIDGGESRTLILNGGTRMSGKGSTVMREAGAVTIAAGASTLPDKFSLSQNYPNPFNPVTKIVYELPAEVKVNLTVFDILGRQVAVLADEVQAAGVKTVVFDAGAFPSGVYFYRLQAGNFTATRKLMLLR